MLRRHLWRRAVALAVTAALVAGACTSDRIDGGDATPAPSEPTEPASASPSATPSPTASVLGGFDDDSRVLDVAVADASTLDPMRIADPSSVLIARQLFEGLTRWDQASEQVLPAAAESWSVSKQGRRWRFNLRQGMSFHNGTPVKAQDFVFAFNRIARRSSASDLAYTLEDVQGFTEVNELGQASKLAGLRATDDLTLVFDLERPVASFPAVMTHPGLVPVPRAAVRNQSFLQEPVGNGPFQIAVPWRVGDPVVLEAFEDFYQPPQIAGIRFLPYPDPAESWPAFLDGELDVAEVPASELKAGREAFGERGFLPFLAASFYGVNLRAPVLRDLRVRRAVSLGIDRLSISESIFRGTLVRPRGIVPQGMPGFEEDICGDLCSYAPDVAANIIESLPRRKRRVTIEFTQGQPHRAVARAAREDLTDIGLDVRLREFPFKRYLERLRDGRQGLFRLGWIAEYPVPDVFLTPLFSSDSPDNHSNLSSRRIDRLLNRANRTLDATKRLQLQRRAERLILRTLAVLPLGTFINHWAAQPEVEQIGFDVMGGFDAASVTLAP